MKEIKEQKHVHDTCAFGGDFDIMLAHTLPDVPLLFKEEKDAKAMANCDRTSVIKKMRKNSTVIVLNPMPDVVTADDDTQSTDRTGRSTTSSLLPSQSKPQLSSTSAALVVPQDKPMVVNNGGFFVSLPPERRGDSCE